MDNLKAFLIFIAVVLAVYGGTNFYLYRRILQTVHPSGAGGVVLRGVLLLLMLAYPLGRTLGSNSAVGTVLVWVGSFWLAAVLYGLMIALTFDLVRWGDILFGWLPDWMNADRVQAGRMVVAGSVVVVGMLLVSGYIRASNPLLREIEISLDKMPPGVGEYHIALLADTHLGALFGKRRLERIVEQVNSIDPDLVLIVGDLIDEKPAGLHWVIEPLRKLRSRDGVFVVTGNHELYGGVSEFARLTDAAGIRLLRDEAVKIDGRFILAGLDYRMGLEQHRTDDPPISEVIGRASGLPVVLMEHSPRRKREARDCGVDLMLCGHTHGGQLWPIGYLTSWIFGVRQGLSRYGKMQVFVTNGVGTWGPPVRIAAPSEVVHLILEPSDTPGADYEP